jgi:hypothetical protein
VIKNSENEKINYQSISTGFVESSQNSKILSSQEINYFSNKKLKLET